MNSITHRSTSRSRVAMCLAASLAGLVGCDESGSETELLLDGEGPVVRLSMLLQSELATDDLAAADVDRWVATVDKELEYAAALEPHWTDEIRGAVETAIAARGRADATDGPAREAAAAEARELLDAVPWTAWTTTLIACVDEHVSEADVAEARDSRSTRDPGWQARVRRADRLRTGAGEAMREDDARRSLQRAFYACQIASQLAGASLGVG